MAIDLLQAARIGVQFIRRGFLDDLAIRRACCSTLGPSHVKDGIISRRPPLFRVVASAGFNGFDFKTNKGTQLDEDRAKNIQYVVGQHGAFDGQVIPISKFLTGDKLELEPENASQERPYPFLKFFSDWLFWIVWLALIAVVAWLGVRVIGAAREHGMLVAFLYVLLVIYLLREL